MHTLHPPHGLPVEGEDCFHQLVDSVTDVLWIYQPHSARFVYVSPAYEREWSCSAEALYSDASVWFDRVHPQYCRRLSELFEGLARGDGYTAEYRATARKGEERWIAERAFPVVGRRGQSPRFAGVSRDITQRKTAEFELARLARNKDEFLATLSHELRNPLQAIRAASTLMTRRHAEGLSLDAKAVAVIERQSAHLDRLVEDLLDMACITHGKLGLHLDRIQLNSALEMAVEANRPLLDASRLQLRVAPRPGVWVNGDPVRLTQVFSNLLHNAAKFSTAGGLIVIDMQVNSLNSTVAVSFRDQGIGIAAAQMDSMFDLFVQGEQSLARIRGGLGIGLSLVRSLVDFHGGTISARSDGPGLGSEFIVTLPLNSRVHHTAAAHDVRKAG